MPRLDVNPDDLSHIKAILKQHAPDLEVWVYGSRINGNSHEASDLDLVIRNPDNLQKPMSHLSQLKQLFVDSDLPFLVDLMDWACLPERYRDEIKKRHVVLAS